MSIACDRCNDCGRFMPAEPNNGSWAEEFDFVAMEPLGTRLRCGPCTERLGPVRSNARPHNRDMSPYEGTFATLPTEASDGIAAARPLGIGQRDEGGCRDA